MEIVQSLRMRVNHTLYSFKHLDGNNKNMRVLRNFESGYVENKLSNSYTIVMNFFR